jgi:hypothetical protein
MSKGTSRKPQPSKNGKRTKTETSVNSPSKNAAATLSRTVFETPRTAEYFDPRELQAQTGQPISQFFSVVLKELVDNGLDAAEQNGVQPEIRIGVVERRSSVRLYIGDNGAGIDPGTVQRILNYSTRTSDKSAYRSPTRGAQGNAFKTVLGIPTALGSHKPVTIEAKGVRHTVQPTVDPAGVSHVSYDQEQSPERTGTLIRLELPSSGQSIDPKRWARGFALFNPHAFVKILVSKKAPKQAKTSRVRSGSFYKPTASPEWRKFLPTDLTSPWWYDDSAMGKLVFQHLNAAKQGGKDLTLREFVLQFRGLSASAKTKAICDQFPEINRLSDFKNNPNEAARLLNAMQEETKPPSPDMLGCVGEEHFRSLFERWYGVKRFWYQKTREVVDGVPFVIEAAFAETKRPGHIYHGINFSPTYEDPFRNSYLQGVEEDASGVGVASFFRTVYCYPHKAAAVHLICPALEFMDRGKTRLSLSQHLNDLIGKTLWKVSKTVYKEEKDREKDAARQERRERQEAELAAKPDKQMALTEAVPIVMMDAFAKAAGNLGVVSAHTLYYVVRDMIQVHTARTLTSDYFEQTLLPAYQQEHGRIDGLYYEPRGTLYEPHTGEAIPLGTREVESYVFPSWLYDKILFVEKKGLWPVFQAAHLAERYDMAIVAGEGYATEACRVLFANAEQGKEYQLFVLHDADPAGYNIARTLREETWRMPEHRTQIIDIGLKLKEALDLGLRAEEFTRQKAIPQGLELTELEREYFEGRKVGKKSWIAKRVELNAFTSPDLIAYTQRGLEANGVRGKVIPDGDAMPALARALYHMAMRSHVKEALERILNLEDLIAGVSRHMQSVFPVGQARAWVTEAFGKNPTLRWQDPILDVLHDKIRKKDEAVERQVREALQRAIQ